MKIKFLNSHKFYLNLVLQRTGHFTELTGINGKKALSEWMKTGDSNQIIELLRNKEVLREYLKICSDSARSEADIIFDLVGKNGVSLANSNVLSIGCGNGIIELMLFHIAKNSNQKITELTLVDSEDSSDVKGFGYKEEAASYASLSDTLLFLKNNFVDSDICLYNPFKHTLPPKKYSLIFSLLAMGFHFPLDGYMDYICENVSYKGLLIFDCRKGTNQDSLDELFNNFKLIARSDHGKFERITLQNDRKG